MDDLPNSYLSPKLTAQAHPRKGGWGVFAVEHVPKGELLLVWGGKIVDYAQLMRLPEQVRRHSIQVEEDLYQVPTRVGEPAEYVNHSCNANAGMLGQIALVAMRDIEVGEEICMDYAMCDGSPYDEFDCGCGEQECRGRITGQDWSRPELHERYRGYFSTYLQRRIDRMVSGPIAAQIGQAELVRVRRGRNAR